MTAQRISARNLLREAFAATGAIYAPLLIINSPSLIFGVVDSVVNLNSPGALQIINLFCRLALILVWGAAIFYTYQSLTGHQVTVNEAFGQANRRFSQLFLVNILYSLLVCAGVIALIIPGIYVSYRLMFSSYATVIDNSSAVDSLRSSWESTKGRWWLLFRTTFLLLVVIIVPMILIPLLIDLTGESTAYKVAVNVLVFLVTPLINVYLVLLYLRLRESAATINRDLLK